jgi:hypothetical protein
LTEGALSEEADKKEEEEEEFERCISVCDFGGFEDASSDQGTRVLGSNL